MPAKTTDQVQRLLALFENLGRRNTLRDPIAASVEAMGLTGPQLHAVLWIGREHAPTMGEVAQRLGVTEKTITGIVDRLERAGFVSRARDTADRRVVRVTLTPRGQRTRRRLEKVMHRKMTEFLALLGPADSRQLFAILERLVAKIAAAAPAHR